MPFFTYSQNNSGGGFDYDAESGITDYVIIEADDAEEANYRAQRIGLYFDGVDSGQDCGCCGDRWSEAWRSDGDEFPTVYGKTVADYERDPNAFHWIAAGYNVFIHFKDGRIQGAVPGPDMVSDTPKELN